MHNSNSKKILNDTATTNLLEISPANQAVLNHNLSIAINADRPSYQNHFINHSFYPPLVTTSYNHQKHAQDVNDNLSEFFNQTTKTHENLVKKNPLEAQTYLQNRLGFLGKAIDPNDPSSALNQSGFQHVPVVDKFGQTHANFGSAQINNLKTLSDMWQMNNDLLSQRSHVPTSYYSGQAPASPAGPAPASPGPAPDSPGQDSVSPAGPAPASPGPAPDSPGQDSNSPRPDPVSPAGPAPASPAGPARSQVNQASVSVSLGPAPSYPRWRFLNPLLQKSQKSKSSILPMIQGSNQDFQAENGSTHQQKPSPSAPYESSGSDLYKHISISDSSHQIRDRDSSSFGTIRPLKGDLVRIVADLQRGNKSPQQGPTLTTSLSPQRFGGGRG